MGIELKLHNMANGTIGGKGIAFAGNLTVDYIKYIEAYPAPQSLAAITHMERSVGGLVCNCALALAKLDPGLPIKAIGVVGQDEAGDFVLSRLGAAPSIDTSGIARMGSTAYTDVMTDARAGQRTFFTYNGANSLLTPESFDFAALADGIGILHIGYILLLDGLDAPDGEYPTAMCRALDSAREAGMQTSIDVVSEDGGRFAQLVPPALKYADYCIINENEASRTTGIPLRAASGDGGHGCNGGDGGIGNNSGNGGNIGTDSNGAVLEENLPAACEKLMGMGVGRWAVIHMPEMYCGLERGGAFVMERSWKIPEGFLKSPVGAGDAFASGVLYGARSGWSLARSLHAAGAVAAYSLSGAGGGDSLKPLAELMEEMEGWQ